MNRLSIDDERGAGGGLRSIGCRWLVACGLMAGAGCAAQPIDRMDPPDSLTARPGASGPESGGLAAVPEVAGRKARIERQQAAPAMTEPSVLVGAPSGGAKLVLPPEAWRRPGPPGDPSEWQRALEAEVGSVTAAPLDMLAQVKAIEDASEATLWRANTLAFRSRQRLDDVLEGDATLAAELARVKAAGSQAGAARLGARLEESWERFSTMRVAHGPVTFGLQGSPDAAMPAGGPGLTAHVGAPGRFPGKVDVGLSMGQVAPAFAPLSSAFGAAQGFADERLRTFGLRSEPLALDPGAAQQPAAGPMRAWVAHQYGGAIKWWLSAGPPQDIWSGAGAAGAAAPEQTANVDGGLQYDLGSDVAVVAAYRYADELAAVRSSPFRGSAGAGQRSTEQIQVASLRLVWRFTPPKGARSAGPVTGD